MIDVRQDNQGNIKQVSAGTAYVTWDDFGNGCWQLLITVQGDVEHRILLRQQGHHYAGPIILEGKNFDVTYSREPQA